MSAERALPSVEELVAWVPRLAGRRVLVLGDLFLDRYVMGRPTRISREAPVVILELDEEFDLPGGASAPGRIIQALGSQAFAFGLIGADEPGQALRSQLLAVGIDATGVLVDEGRPTITKTRVFGGDRSIVRQQIVRIDRHVRRPIDGSVAERMSAMIGGLAPRVDAVLVSDYQSGVVTPDMAALCLQAARQHRKLTSVDSQGDLLCFTGFDLVKAASYEVMRVLDCPLSGDADYAAAGRRLLAKLNSRSVIITRGAEGVSAVSPDEHHHIPVVNRSEVFDVTGAGDTVIAVATLAVLAGADLQVAAYLANCAASVVVRKFGNATLTLEELAEAVVRSTTPSGR